MSSRFKNIKSRVHHSEAISALVTRVNSADIWQCINFVVL